MPVQPGTHLPAATEPGLRAQTGQAQERASSAAPARVSPAHPVRFFKLCRPKQLSWGLMRQQRHNPRDNDTVIPSSGEQLAVTSAFSAAGMNPPGLCLLKIGFPALTKSNLIYLLTHVHLLTHSPLSPDHTARVCLPGHAVEASRRSERLQRNEFLFNYTCLIINQEQSHKDRALCQTGTCWDLFTATVAK